MTEWILVEDRLPEKGKYVLICNIKNKFISIGSYTITTENQRNFFREKNSNKNYLITHWMQLPDFLEMG
jgi:hypothetical protein